MNFTVGGPHLGQAAVCIPIVRSLPEWFGIEATIVHYAAEIDHLPTFLAGNSAGSGGFLSLKQHSPYAAEVYVMGVRRECQRTGLGRRLLQDAEAWLRSQGVEYLQVKTLDQQAMIRTTPGPEPSILPWASGRWRNSHRSGMRRIPA